MRDAAGEPVVIRNAPLLDDGTPMPTRYWLVGPTEVLAVSRLESAGGVRRAEAEVDDRRRSPTPTAATPPSATPTLPAGADRRPRGGVGGTREGVKCLHAHYAWHLAGGDDPVGRWVAARLAERARRRRRRRPRRRSPTPGTTRGSRSGRRRCSPTELADPDPPTPAQLTNAIGRVTDHVDDVRAGAPGGRRRRRRPRLAATRRGTWRRRARRRAATGRASSSSATTSRTCSGRSPPSAAPTGCTTRGSTRTGSTPCSATCCVVVAMMRRLQLARRHVRRRSGAVMARHPSAGAQRPRAAPAVRPAGDAAPADARRTSPSGARCAGATRPG